MANKDPKIDMWDSYNSWWPSDVLTTGSSTESVLVQGELFDPDKDLKEKYPALKKAWKQYMLVKKLCEAKENETR